MARTRCKREDSHRTKHDSSFSKWKVLIGPCDWEGHSNGKEGSARYRIHNLPSKSGPGVYELGVAVTHGDSGRKIDSNPVVVVYLGQAENVRTRLQRYGRSGAHLGKSDSSWPDFCPDDSNASSDLAKGKGLFGEIFLQGYPIVYRWAPMPSKEDARQTETLLLNIFDYAWNSSHNGTRRPDDILQKLHKIASGRARFSNMTRMLLPFTDKKVGIRIKSCKLPTSSDRFHESDEDSYNFLSRVFKFNRSQPMTIQDINGVIQENAKICGVVVGDGYLCRSSPAKGRMRCSEHKGMRTNRSTGKTEVESIADLKVETNVYCETEGDSLSEQDVRHDAEKVPQTAAESPVDEKFTVICGISLNDGSPCTRQPVKGRKRCEEHKGKRIKESIHKSAVAGNSQLLLNAVS